MATDFILRKTTGLRPEPVGALQIALLAVCPQLGDREFARKYYTGIFGLETAEAIVEAMDMDTCLVPTPSHGPDCARELAAWQETARVEANNKAHYRDVVQRVGELMGDEAFKTDTGKVLDEVMSSRLPELVRQEVKRFDLTRFMHHLRAWGKHWLGKPSDALPGLILAASRRFDPEISRASGENLSSDLMESALVDLAILAMSTKGDYVARQLDRAIQSVATFPIGPHVSPETFLELLVRRIEPCA